MAQVVLLARQCISLFLLRCAAQRARTWPPPSPAGASQGHLDRPVTRNRSDELRHQGPGSNQVSAAATQERQEVRPRPIDVLDRRQIEIESAPVAYRVGGAPGLFKLRDPRSREIALELQADTVRLGGHCDPEHRLVRRRRTATAMPNVSTCRVVPQLAHTEGGER